MNHRLDRTKVLLVTFAVTLALTGCLDLGGSADNSTSALPDNPGTGSTNRAPIISGAPASAVVVGDSYLFSPTASDPDGDQLTFMIENLPTWATFDSANGTVSGVASLGNEGTYSDIRISVTDGNLSSSLPAFSITVTQAALGSATLSWTPPTQNSDNSPLNDLAAYKIYYGTEPDSYTNQIRIDNPGISSYVVENLVPDTYYFVATAVNSADVESGFSNMASKVVTSQ